LVEVASLSGRVIRRFPVADPQAFAIGNGAIWIAHLLNGTVTRVDPRDGRTIATIHLTLPKPIQGNDHDWEFLPSSISFGNATVWVSTARGWIAEINPRTSQLITTVSTMSEDNATATGSHGTWVAEELGGLGFIPRHSQRLTLQRISEAGQSVDVVGLVSGGELIWALGSFAPPADPTKSADIITAIDARTGHIAHQTQFSGDYSFAYGNGALYGADFSSGLLVRVGTDYKVHRLRLPRGSESLVAATPGAVWATTSSGRMLRITVTNR